MSMGSGFNCYDTTFIAYEQEIHHNVSIGKYEVSCVLSAI